MDLDQWLNERTFHHSQFSNLGKLVDLKVSQGLKISLCFPALNEAKTGVAFLADQAKVPILPVAVSGTWQITSEILKLKRPVIEVNIGQVFMLPPVDRKTRDYDLQQNTDEIMCQLAALLPPENRGFYADHPRLKELLAAQEN